MIGLDVDTIAGPADLARLLAERPDAATPALARRLKERVEALHLDDARAAGALARCVEIVAERCGDLESAALARRARGLAALSAGRYREVVAEYEAAERLYREAGDEVERARVLRSMIDPLVHVGRVEEAFAAGREARAVFERAGEARLAAQTDANLGNVLQTLDRHAEALVAYDRARAAFREAGDGFGLAVVSFNRANALAELDRLDAAERGYRAARRWFRARGHRLREAQCLYALAGLAFLRGRVSESLRTFARVRALDLELGDERHAALCALDESELLLSVNAWEEARDRAGEAATALEALGMLQDAARAEAFLGLAALHLGRRREAGRRLDAAAARLSAGGNEVQAALVGLYRAELALRFGGPVRALGCSRAAGRLFEERGMQTKEAYARVLSAEALARLGRLDAARDEALRALTGLSRAPSAGIEWRARRALARAESDPAESGRQRARAIDVVERQRARIVPDELLAAFHRDKVELYADAAREALEAGRPERAFELADRAKSRVLAERLARPGRPGARDAETRAALRRELDELDRRAKTVNEREAAGAAVPDAARRELAEREARVAALHRALELEGDGTASPAAGGLVEALGRALVPGEAVVEYVDLGGELRAAVVDARGLQWSAPLAATAEVAEAVERWAFQARKTALGAEHLEAHRAALAVAADAALERLAALVWTPVAPLLGEARRLTVVPGGPLGDVPFAALRAEGRYLVETLDVAAAPSARALVGLRRASRDRGAGALVIGAPAPGLPGIAAEVAAVAARLPAARVLEGPAATRAAVLREAPRAALLHVAAHARFRGDAPLFSAIDLADGRLGFYDLFDLRLAAELVVLSGCETGSARVEAGDERMGLARGFLAAGAGALVASLWPVEDAATVALMDAFYERVAGGAGPRAALSGAMRERIAAGALPHEWAAFALSGGGA